MIRRLTFFSTVAYILFFSTVEAFAGDIALTLAEKNFIGTHPLIRVANEMDWPPFDYVENNMPKGYSIDLLNLIAQKAGLTLNFVNGRTWDELLTMGMARQVDVFPAIWKTPKRQDYFHFTPPYIDTPYILVIHHDTESISDINSLKGKILTGIKGFASTEQVKQLYPDITVKEVDSAVTGLRQVSYGTADAYLGSMAETNFVIKSHLVPNLKIAGETDLGGRIETPLLHVGIRKDWPLLRDIIQKGMDAITHEERQDLQLKWLNLENQSKTLILDDTERAFLQNHHVLRAAFLPDWPPVTYTGTDKKMSGIASDYLDLISRALGVEIKPVQISSWSETVDAVKNNTIDLISAVSQAAYHKDTMIFTPTYLSFPMVIITREDVPYIGNIEFLNDKAVAVVANQSPHTILAGKYKTLPLMKVKGTKEGLMAVAGKDAFAFVGSLATVGHVIGREGFSTLKVSGELPYTVNIAMACSKDMPVLRDLLQKALNTVSAQDRNAIYSKWSSVTFEYQPDYSLMWKLGGGGLLVLVLILYWNGMLRRMAGDLESARDAAEAANRSKSIFLANMSHELRTPLNAILGFSQIMSEDKSLNRTQKENLKIINSSGEHLLALITDILDMSKIEAGKITLKESIFNLPRFMENINNMLRAMAHEKGLSLAFALSPELPGLVRADQSRLRQILVNLIVNGLKNTAKGGVTVLAEPGENDGDDRFCIRFTVRDTGRGIEPAFQTRIFEPFLQVNGGNQANEGTGLGLSICRTLVERMGGKISVESVPEQGASFSFYIQAGKETAPDRQRIESPSPGREHFSRPAPGLLADLPARLCEPLRQAVFSFDYEMTMDAIKPILKTDPHLGNQLETCAQGYQFGVLQALFTEQEEPK